MITKVNFFSNHSGYKCGPNQALGPTFSGGKVSMRIVFLTKL